MLNDISVFLDKINSKNLKEVVFAGYEVISLAEAEMGTYDLGFVIENDERYMGTVNLTGEPKKLMEQALMGTPISVNTLNSTKHTGLPGDDYVLYYGKFVNL